MKIKHIVNHTINFIRLKPIDTGLYLLAALVLLKLGSLYFSVSVDDGNWNEFKDQHHCRLHVNDSGNQQLSWYCDDGKTYYRWRQQR
ncbi:MAG: hypothetical protein ABL925_10025 [Methylococcales bacterium]